MKIERGYVLANNQYISTVTGRRWPATPENLEALLRDNALIDKANATRLPEPSRTATWRVAAESAGREPTGPNVWLNAIAIHKAVIASNNFQPDSKRTAEIEAMQREAEAFEARKEKLLTLQQPVESEKKSPESLAADMLRQNPGNLGKLADKIADRLDAKSDADKVAAEIAAKDVQRRAAPEFVRALEFQRLEVSVYERTAVPADMLANAKKLLAGLEDGSVDAPAYWGVWEPEQSQIKHGYFDTLAKSKKEEIQKLRDELQIMDDEPPAAPQPEGQQP
jgi:hypothetical protein